MKLGSLFDGVGGFPLAAQRHEIEPVWASEVENFCIKVTEKHFPNMKHLGDITKIKGNEIEPVDIITAGSPCFPAGTLVLTELGYKPIENIQVDERVLTHTGKWQRVLKTGGTIADTVLVKGFGHPGIETTPEHPFYSSEKKRKYYTQPKEGKRPNPTTYMDHPKWTEAKDMEKKFWATPLHLEPLPIPPVECVVPEHVYKEPTMDSNFWWFIGYWLGNGWARNTQRNGRPDGQSWGQIVVCAPYTKADMLETRLNQLGFTWRKNEERTAVKFITSHKSLVEWMIENFGHYAYGKYLPSWCLSMNVDDLTHLFNGYLSADGSNRKRGGYSITSVSKQLSVGMRLVAERLGYASSLYYEERPPQHVIEGRAVNQRSTYTIHARLERNQTSRKHEYGMAWGLVRSVTEKDKKVKVYNLEVENDNSYIVENIVVHNCQDLSVAGKRAGLEGARSGLFMEFIRIVREMREATNNEYPRYIIWENVPGAFSSNNGDDFRAVLEEIAETKIPIPKSGRWADAGMVRGNGCEIAWRCLDAQYWGVPQRRKRIFLVCDFRGERAGEILFEQSCLSRDFAKSGKKRKGSAGDIGDGTKATEYDCGTDDRIGGWVDRDDRIFAYQSDTKGSTVQEHIYHKPNGIADSLTQQKQHVISRTEHLTGWDNQEKRIFSTSGVAPTLSGSDGGGGRTGVGYVAIPVLSDQGGSIMSISHGVVPTLRAETHGNNPIVPVSMNSKQQSMNIGVDVVNTLGANDYKEPQVVAFQPGNLSRKAGAEPSTDVFPTLGATTLGDQFPRVATYWDGGNISDTLDCSMLAKQQMMPEKRRMAAVVVPGANTTGSYGETVGALCARDFKGVGSQYVEEGKCIVSGYAVRRLTPTECERLQGFPDKWTSGGADTARYKALGNSLAVPCVEWIMSRIAAQQNRAFKG